MLRGKFHMVPENFDFPSHNVKVMFEYWIFGDIQRKIRPLDFLDFFLKNLTLTLIHPFRIFFKVVYNYNLI